MPARSINQSASKTLNKLFAGLGLDKHCRKFSICLIANLSPNSKAKPDKVFSENILNFYIELQPHYGPYNHTV